MLRCLLLPFASAALLAQDRTPHLAPADPTPPASILASAPFDGVWIDPEPARDGRFWCRGNRYKMSFGTDGARYVPLFSSRAPRHFPMAFHLVGAPDAAPERRGSGFVFRRGSIEERWELTPAGVEQSFVLPSRPLGNALVIEVATALPFTGADAAGLHFLAGGWGEVVYGHATAIERDGDRVPLPTTFAAGAIRIELPTELQFPLVVDPFVTTIGVASNEAFDNRNPDVAYSADADRWCVVMEERVSVLDTDIKVPTSQPSLPAATRASAASASPGAKPAPTSWRGVAWRWPRCRRRSGPSTIPRARWGASRCDRTSPAVRRATTSWSMWSSTPTCHRASSPAVFSPPALPAVARSSCCIPPSVV
jgi:hypothetical protein